LLGCRDQRESRKSGVRCCVENLVRIVEAVKVSGDLAKIIRHIMWLKSFSGSDNHIGESGEVDDES
jgi:hypothetical protein